MAMTGGATANIDIAALILHQFAVLLYFCIALLHTDARSTVSVGILFQSST